MESRGVRGAITVNANTKDEIQSATVELLNEIHDYMDERLSGRNTILESSSIVMEFFGKNKKDKPKKEKCNVFVKLFKVFKGKGQRTEKDADSNSNS